MTTNNIKELSIQVNLNGLSFCILNRSENTIEFLEANYYSKKTTPFKMLEALKEVLESKNEFDQKFEAVTVIHQNELSTFVPEAFHKDEQNAEYLKFNSKILKTDLVSQDRLTVNKSVNTYVPYVNINNYIFERYGEFVYKHASTIFVDTILQQKISSKNPEVFINVNTQTFEMVVAHNDELRLYNHFEYGTAEDFIYFVLFTMDQLHLDTEITKIKLSGLIFENDELYKMLFTYVRFIEFWKPNFTFKLSESLSNRHTHEDFILLNSF